MTSQILGYIVTNSAGATEPLELVKGGHYPPDGALQVGDYVTVFASREKAHEVISQTIEWAKAECEREGIALYEWAQAYKYDILELKGE